jgi:ubiquinone/menaquinone biosynthesis C-methylase UbiE
MNPVTADSVLGLSRAFMEARVLLTGAELDLFTLLSRQSLAAEEIAKKLGTNTRGQTIVLDALTGMGLLAKSAGRYACPPEVAEILASDSPVSALPMILHAAGLWHKWTALTDIVRHGPPDCAPAAFEEEGQLKAFIWAMHVVGRRMADKVVADIGVGSAKALLDVGGATGTYTEAFLRACPEMHATLFDRAAVIDMARERLGQEKLLDRVILAAGDFYKDELPGGHDLVLLSAIIHQNSPEQNVALHEKVLRSLVPGGRLVIRDHVMSPDHTQPPGGAMFAVNMLVATPAGGTYTFAEIRETLAAAGFERMREIKADERMNGLVEAFKPVV